MIEHKPLPLKTWGLWLLLMVCALVTAYVLFMAILSIRIGVTHWGQYGSWLPILVGALCFAAVLWLFLGLSKFIFARMKSTDTVRA